MCKVTAQQFLKVDDPPGARLELVDGEIKISRPPTPAHSHVVIALIVLLKNHVNEDDRGELLGSVNTIFGEHDVRRPDLLYFTQSRRHLIGKKAIEGPPDLCIEVLSPSSVKIDRDHKFKQYAKGGVQFY